MMMFQTACPKCGQFLWVGGDAPGHQTNCPACHHVFRPEPPPPVGVSRGAALRLLPDAGAARGELGAYAALAPAGVTPGSPMATVRRASTPSEETIEARDALKMARSRLKIDMLLYPVWETEGDHAG